MSIVINILLAIHVLVSLLIIFLVLMQRPKSEGLGAAFGGGMTESVFGAGATNALQTITRYLGGMFFFLTLALSWLYIKQSSHKSGVQQRLSAPTVVPAAPATPSEDRKAETGDRKGESTPAAPKPSGTPAAPAATSAPVPAAPAPASTPAAGPAAPAAATAPAAPGAPAKAATPAAAPATPTPANPAQDAKPADKVK